MSILTLLVSRLQSILLGSTYANTCDNISAPPIPPLDITSHYIMSPWPRHLVDVQAIYIRGRLVTGQVGGIVSKYVLTKMP